MNDLSARVVKPNTERLKFLTTLLACVALLNACSIGGPRISGDGPGNDRQAQRASEVQVQNLPKSRYGNMDSYKVFGKQYTVLESAENFTEQGVASWYGSKFHGRKTSSGEVYDMHALTAAHKHLPLPTFVRVTNHDNGNSVVVKVNDRGPFVGDRIIDMSYAAAKRLDMTQAGTANVSVVALSTHHVASNPAPSNEALPVQQDVVAPVLQAVPVVAIEQSGEKITAVRSSYYIQLGAFKHAPNAKVLVSDVEEKIGKPAFVEMDRAEALYRVRMGPFRTEENLNNTVSELASAGIESYTTVGKIQ